MYKRTYVTASNRGVERRMIGQQTNSWGYIYWLYVVWLCDDWSLLWSFATATWAVLTRRRYQFLEVSNAAWLVKTRLWTCIVKYYAQFLGAASTTCSDRATTHCKFIPATTMLLNKVRRCSRRRCRQRKSMICAVGRVCWCLVTPAWHSSRSHTRVSLRLVVMLLL